MYPAADIPAGDVPDYIGRIIDNEFLGSGMWARPVGEKALALGTLFPWR